MCEAGVPTALVILLLLLTHTEGIKHGEATPCMQVQLATLTEVFAPSVASSSSLDH
jgi:hypothetical protein